jgi:hypothetical protein
MLDNLPSRPISVWEVVALDDNPSVENVSIVQSDCGTPSEWCVTAFEVDTGDRVRSLRFDRSVGGWSVEDAPK